jgi:hypothetical protein
MFDLLDGINFLLYLIFLITIPLFLLPMVSAVIGLFKEKVVEKFNDWNWILLSFSFW